MREELKHNLHDYITITAKIMKFGRMKFDGHDRYLDDTACQENAETRKILEIKEEFRNDDGMEEPIYYVGQTTLLTDVRCDGKLVGDGHLWLPEDLKMKGYKVGEEIKICGRVEAYKKNKNQLEYGVNKKRAESINETCKEE